MSNFYCYYSRKCGIIIDIDFGKGGIFMLRAILFDLHSILLPTVSDRKQEDIPHTVPGIVHLLEALHKQDILTAVISLYSRRETEFYLRQSGMHRYVDRLLADPSMTPMNHLFTQMLQRLGTSADSVLYVSSDPENIQEAASLRIGSIGYTPVDSYVHFMKEALVLIESFEDLTPSFFQNVWLRSRGKPVTIADTRRLIIRELAEEDIDDLYQIYQDPQIRKYIDNIDDYREIEVNKLRAYIRNVYSFYGYGLWGVFSKTTHGIIGRCGIENHQIDGREEIMLSYLLDSHHWGYGYALECCRAVLAYAHDELDIHRIVAVIEKHNTRSIHTAQNLNMTLEKEISWHDKDCFLYAIHFD